jgi:hypothetical protein
MRWAEVENVFFPFWEAGFRAQNFLQTITIKQGRTLWGGAHLPCDRFAPPLRIFVPPMKSHAPPLGKVSMIDRSGNLALFGCLGLRVYKVFFL